MTGELPPELGNLFNLEALFLCKLSVSLFEFGDSIKALTLFLMCLFDMYPCAANSNFSGELPVELGLLVTDLGF